MSEIDVKIKMLHPDAMIPKCATSGSAGFDLVAIEDVTVMSGTTVLVKTGLAFGIPEGFELQIRPRSGMSLKTPLRVANSPGTVDADFTGEVCVIISNISSIDKIHLKRNCFGGVLDLQPEIGIGFGPGFQEIKKGDRIAQGVICPVFKPNFIKVEDLKRTERGSGGFGSTGK